MKLRIPRFAVLLIAIFGAFGLFGFLDSLMSGSQVSPALRAVIPAAPVAEARILTGVISPGIESGLVLANNERLIEVKGHIACDEGEQLRIDVRITQGATGATAVGHTQDFCTGDVQTWTGRAVVRGRNAVVAGAAEACAVAQTRFRGQVTDSFAWCKDVALVSDQNGHYGNSRPNN